MNWKYNKTDEAWEVTTNTIKATISYDRHLGYCSAVYNNNITCISVTSYKYYKRLSDAKRGVKRTLRNLSINLSEVVEDAWYLSRLKVSGST